MALKLERVAHTLDPSRLDALRRESEREGYAFLRRLLEQWKAGGHRFDGPGEALLLAAEAEEVVGVGGIQADPYAGAPGVGRIRHVYVRADRRRTGVGRCLVTRLVQEARGVFHRLDLRTGNPGAAAFYRTLGFAEVRGEPFCTHRLLLGSGRGDVAARRSGTWNTRLEREHGDAPGADRLRERSARTRTPAPRRSRPPMKIRPHGSQDTEAVVRLALRAWEPVFASMEEHLDAPVYRAFFPDWRAHQRRAVEAALESPEQSVWVAEREGAPVGFVAVVLHRDDALGEIHMVAVDPDHQGEGIGTALTGFALARMQEAGMSVAMVETGGDPGHAPARKTYERAGFRLWPVARFFKKL